MWGHRNELRRGGGGGEAAAGLQLGLGRLSEGGVERVLWAAVSGG